MTAKSLATAKRNGRILLGFNEPDHEGQARMSVKEALELWPQLEGTGMRLGSSACAGGADLSNGWFSEFMKGAKAKGFRIDFICVHRYQNNFSDPAAATQNLKRFLEDVYALYHQPLWLTEFAMTDWKCPASRKQQIAFMKQAIPMLQALPFVERYAWFAMPPNPDGDDGSLANASLCDGNGSLNDAGAYYRNSE